MGPDKLDNSAEAPLQARLDRVEQQAAGMREALLTAIAAQEQLQSELRAALQELSEALRQRNSTNRPVRAALADPQIQRIETRLRGVEQRLDQACRQVTGILESRIWRTLVKGSGFFTRFVR